MNNHRALGRFLCCKTLKSHKPPWAILFLQIRNGQHVRQCVHDPAAPVSETPSAKALPGH